MISKLISYDHVPGGFEAVQKHGSRAGFDLGRTRHPSHLAVITRGDDGRLYQIASVWFDSETYTRQLEELDAIFKELCVEHCCWDATRGELAVLDEQWKLPAPMVGGGVTFTPELKARLAGRLSVALDNGELVLLPDERQRRSILSVTNTLQSEESAVGHGDAFWSIALALETIRQISWEWSATLKQSFEKGRAILAQYGITGEARIEHKP